jgi:hypothetical protein
MTRPRDRKGNFLPKTPTTKIGPSNPEIGPETLENFLEREAREFENLSKERQSSPRVMADEEEIFEFPIRESDGEAKMKNINPSALPHFHGLVSRDPDTFLFEFAVICWTYDYTTDEHKLKRFPSTLKNLALRWFMSLEGNNITTWDQMKNTFSERYKDCCRVRDIRDEIFKMTQGPDEFLEDFEEIFLLSYTRVQNCALDEDSLKLVLLIGVREDLVDTLNLLSNGDIYQLDYDDIKRIFKNHSRSSRKKGRSSRGLIPQSSNPTSHDNGLVQIRTICKEGIPLLVNEFSLQQDSDKGRGYNNNEDTKSEND